MSGVDSRPVAPATTPPSSATSPPERPPLRRSVALVASVGLIVPALANTLFHVLTPLARDTPSLQVAQARLHPDLAYIAVLQFLLPVLCVGVAVLAWQAAAGSRRLALVGGALLAAGYLLSGLDNVGDLLPAVVAAHASPAASVHVLNAWQNGLPAHLGTAALLVGQGPGLVVLGIALWRSRVVSRWLAAGMVITLPLHFLTHSGSSDRLPALSWGWLTLVLAGCAVTLVRSSQTGSKEIEASGPWTSSLKMGTMAG